MIIAIDGPAGAGKSTIAQRVAQQLGFQLIDTGAIYRTVAWKAGQNGLELEDGGAVAEMARGLSFRFDLVDGLNTLFCNGEAVGQEIRSPEVSYGASIVSAHPEVRGALLDIQRDLGRSRSSVLEGRDIGTVVFPDAEVKIFLTATPEERARRRVEQMAEAGDEADYDEVLSEIVARDDRDSSRSAAPLKKAEDAHAIDSTRYSIDEVVEQILGLVPQE
jgi:cytidylate kinase